MIYARRFGAFMPVVSLVTTLMIGYVIKPDRASWSPGIVFMGAALWLGIYIAIYVLNLISIRLFGRPDFDSALRQRWQVAVSSSECRTIPIETFVDRVADLQFRFSVPSLVKEVFDTLSEEQRTVCANLEKTIKQYSSQNDLRAFISVLGNRWTAANGYSTRPPSLIDDPVHGCITLDSRLATLVAQPIVQRLGSIRQLSFSYTRFPSATHSRLSHVLGVAHNVERALSGIFSRGVYYEEGGREPVDLPKEILVQQSEIVMKAKVLAILHDLGHGPFGHALDNYVGYLNRHRQTSSPDKIYSRLYLQDYLSTTLRRLALDPEELGRILNDEERADLTGFDYLVGELIDSAMDVDRMDYLIRDAHMTGVSMGFTNSDALIQCVRPLKVGERYLLTFHEDALMYMEHLLYAREAMYKSCYEHPRKRAAERLFERLIYEIALEDPETIDSLYLLTDDELICALRLVNLKSDRAKQLLERLMASTDYAVIHDVYANNGNVDISEEVRAWLRGATLGRGKASYIDKPRDWEDSIARSSVGAEYISGIQVIVPSASAYDPKFNAALILIEDGGAYSSASFFEVASGVKDVLSAMNLARARIKVMCSADFGRPERERIKDASVQLLGSR